MIEVNLPNDGSDPQYECWGESNDIDNMHINPEDDQSFQIDVDKDTHEFVVDEYQHAFVIKVTPKKTVSSV